ncbi:hypothetical protein LOZ65_006964, partial [Ophidiomyces ophidiicola]
LPPDLNLRLDGACSWLTQNISRMTMSAGECSSTNRKRSPYYFILGTLNGVDLICSILPYIEALMIKIRCKLNEAAVKCLQITWNAIAVSYPTNVVPDLLEVVGRLAVANHPISSRFDTLFREVIDMVVELSSGTLNATSNMIPVKKLKAVMYPTFPAMAPMYFEM